VKKISESKWSLDDQNQWLAVQNAERQTPNAKR
jgi:hypothetical protein